MTTESTVESTLESKGLPKDVAADGQTKTSPIGGAASTLHAMLYRHPREKLVGGVCGGLADYLGWDPVLVRVLWVVATLATSGAGFLAYLAFWLLLPVGTANTGQERAAAIQLNQDNVRRVAMVFIALGVLWLLANLGILPVLWGTLSAALSVVFWPAVLIIAGYLLLRGMSAGDWKVQMGSWFDRTRAQVNGKVPTRSDMKSTLQSAQQRIPLKRSHSDRMLLGVCGGIGKRIGVDSNLVRLVWAALTIGSVGMGVLVYVAVGLLLPEESVAELQPYSDAVQDVQVIDGTATRKV